MTKISSRPLESRVVLLGGFERERGEDMRSLVVIPAYNEAANLPRVLDSLRSSGVDVCVVDDGSRDATAEVARQGGALTLRNPLNLGIGGAVQTGYLWARAHGYDVVVQVDGDGQHDPAYLFDLLGTLESEKADLVIGSRFLTKGGFRSTLSRRLGIRYLSALLRFRSRVKVTDPTSGFRAAGPRAVRLFADHYPSDYPEPESIALAARAGLKVVEVPVKMRERASGTSSIRLFGTLYYLVKVSLALALSTDIARRQGKGTS
jgi:glycosyltransferase involved in cell wall biosynthesis